ncbi:hypothetical protein [Mariprofundus sp. KV]|uniref:hypothetical protein n=1 Tax=Mariprofundus sp. KV TaxID=2608715 RepID=UPI00159F8D68|nr:hypothetical protein [Mariprofundus sp. KV]NWF37123.1 hypothetical protein [Mariprofundus sp. KV]
MSEITFLSSLGNINWSDGLQWYFNHLDAGYLLRVWVEGSAFTPEDWMSMLLLAANLVAAITLAYQLIKRVRGIETPLSATERTSQTANRAADESQENLEAHVSGQPA